VDWTVEANVSEKLAVSIFRTEVTGLRETIYTVQQKGKSEESGQSERVGQTQPVYHFSPEGGVVDFQKTVNLLHITVTVKCARYACKPASYDCIHK
jgi:hypothetical protein